MNTIKPGTRCECRDPHKNHMLDGTHGPENVYHCTRDAVRMVTVRVKIEQRGRYNDVINRPLKFREKQVPMCAPCADHHKK